MALNDELKLTRPIESAAHEALLNIYFTAACLKKRADEFFRPYGLTDVQFNALMLLKHQGSDEGGLNQVQLGEMMLVNRANITSLIDRMERAGMVERAPDKSDRRYNVIRLTGRGRKVLARVEPLYMEQVKKVMAVCRQSEQKALVSMLERIRNGIDA